MKVTREDYEQTVELDEIKKDAFYYIKKTLLFIKNTVSFIFKLIRFIFHSVFFFVPYIILKGPKFLLMITILLSAITEFLGPYYASAIGYWRSLGYSNWGAFKEVVFSKFNLYAFQVLFTNDVSTFSALGWNWTTTTPKLSFLFTAVVGIVSVAVVYIFFRAIGVIKILNTIAKIAYIKMYDIFPQVVPYKYFIDHYDEDFEF